MATIDGGESARFAGMKPPLQGMLMPNGERVVGYSVMDSVALAKMREGETMGNRAGVPDINDEDYTYENRNCIVATIPNKVAGVKVESLPPLTPYHERNDARLALVDVRLSAIESHMAHIERMLHQALNRDGDR